MVHPLRFAGAFVVVGFLLVSGVRAASAVDFGRDIQPILAEHCYHCHGQDEAARKGKLRLDQRDAALKGGGSGDPAIVAGDPVKSALIERILSKDEDEVMPPPEEKKPVKAADLAKLKQWIAEGAPYAEHWAFKGPIKPSVPVVKGVTHPVDAFIRARLDHEGLKAAPIAAPDALCRRLHLDLIGLPPTPAELDAFAQAAKTQGLEVAATALVDRLMADRRFGEKWARHWLDAARYADSNGFEKDLPREQWAWRDWVIRALNADQPYDRFITEQIAGDLLPEKTQDHRVATGFLRNGMINEEGAIIPEQWRLEGMFDRMDAVGSSILGLSLKCAQCHTHKFDPITHTEYFGLFAFLNNTYESQSWVYSDDQLKVIDKIRTDITAAETKLKQEHPDWAAKLAAWETEELRRQDEIAWTVIKADDTHSSTELNHPAILDDGSILTLGHRTNTGDVHLFASPSIEGVTGLRLEILRHGDLPYGGPGRSYRGTWAITEFVVEAKQPGEEKWTKLKLVKASADFEEQIAGMEPEWESKSRDKDGKRLRGPVNFMVDENDWTAWRAQRGPGRRNTDSVAVMQFEQPLTLPAGTRLKIAVVTNHGGDDNGPKNVQVGRFRVSFTHAADPKVTTTPYAAVLALRTPAAERTPEQRQAIFDAWRVTVKEFKAINDEIDRQWARYPEAMTSVFHLAERTGPDVRATHRLDRGAWDQPKELVIPQVPAALHALPPGAKPDRLTFAAWLTDRRSPLTARVAVNRIWQTIFGLGLVETADDFGTRAPEPSHPELLDWLAVDFMEHGWSQKHVIRTLLTSATYRQSSAVSPALLERDPRNRLLARGPRFRADAEVVRDVALSASGLLADKFGGPSVFPPVPESVLEFNFFKPTYWKPAEDATRYSRALYVFRKRSMPDPTMTAFDAPTGDATCTRRPRSNSPLAALTSLNEPIFVEAAQAMAQRVLREAGKSDAERVDYAFRLCTSRRPSAAERDAVTQLLGSRREKLARGELKAGEIAFSAFAKASELPPDVTPNEIAAWAVVSRVLLNLDETVSKN